MNLGARQILLNNKTNLNFNVVRSMLIGGTEQRNNYFIDNNLMDDINTIYPKCWSIWAKKQTATRKGQVIHVTTSGYTANNPLFGFMLATGSSTYLDGGSYLGMHAYSPSYDYYINVSNKWSDTNWHAFHINFNSATQADIYMDGNLIKNGPNALGLSDNQSQMIITIGGSNDWDGRRNFQGLCTRFAIWNRTLTQQEIMQDVQFKNTGVIAYNNLIRFYGGEINSNNEFINHVSPNDLHTFVASGNVSISTQIII